MIGPAVVRLLARALALLCVGALTACVADAPSPSTLRSAPERERAAPSVVDAIEAAESESGAEANDEVETAAAPTSPNDDGATRRTRPKPATPGVHDEARFWVDYGDKAFLVNVRYIDFMAQSVVAVRPARRATPVDGWRRVDVTVQTQISDPTLNHADRLYETVSVDIADTIGEIGRVCGDGERLETKRNDDGEAKTMYRADRQAWVVFARCAPVKQTAKR